MDSHGNSDGPPNGTEFEPARDADGSFRADPYQRLSADSGAAGDAAEFGEHQR